jgi:FkbM family methyltransferase
VVRRPWHITMPPGVSIELAPHDMVASGVLYCGLPDWPEMPFVLDFLKPGDSVIDVGANVGLYSLLAASVEGVTVVGFEPDTTSRQRATANAARNGFAARMTVRPEAVGGTHREAPFTKGLGPMNRLADADAAAGPGQRLRDLRTVEVVTLDDLGGSEVSLIKVDVEGTELAVLQGAEKLLREARPALILEANDPTGLTEYLEPLGYRWVTYDPMNKVLALSQAPSPRKNGILVADLGAAAARLGQ